ncbi:MAG: hypothetical protein CMB75_05075 [Euryarchaeota archaeon]|nr:hypothetical protein [Euryarchaeota archaeon]|tara:strand:- start:2583 stop:4007 length:1425 start_codon:yes stop_codon:yes gene_type:complete
MYSAGPRARAENSESEWFDDLSLVGLSRHFRAVLDQRKLRFEDPRGMGTAIDLGSIDVLRQTDIQKFSSTWLLLGFAFIFSAFRILVTPYSYIAVAVGMISVGVYTAFRLPVLAIDHSNGMRHLISGSQSDLLYLYQMLNRVMHGDTISDARRDIRKSRIYEEEGRVVNSMPDGVHIQTKRPLIGNSSSVPAPISTMSRPNSETSLEVAPASFPAQAPSSVVESALPFDASFGFGDQSDDVGMQWGMFDDPAPAIESVENAVSNEPAAMTGWGSSVISPATNETPPSSSMMLSRATRSYESLTSSRKDLPDPTDAAVREECRPGIVKQARAKKAMKSIRTGPSRISSIVSSDKPRNRSWVERMLVPIPNRSKGRKSYQNQLADVDQDSRLRSAQKLRLRADHQHQTEVDLGRASMRVHPETSGQNALREIVMKKRLEIETPPLEEDGFLPRFSELRPSTYGGEEVGIPGVRYLR